MQVVDEETLPRGTNRGRQLFESKLVPPIARPETVRRTRVLDRLDTDRDRPIVSVVAPPGYGKTTLLTQWAERSTARVAWLSVDEGDNDPESLLAYAAAALDRVEPIDLEWFRRPAPRGLSVASTVVPQLAGAMYSMSAAGRRCSSTTSTCCTTASAWTRSPSWRSTSRPDRSSRWRHGAIRRCRWRGCAPVAACSRSVSPSSR